VTLKDPVFVERGAIVSHLGAMPKLTHAFDAEILWLGPGELKPGDGLTLEFLGRRAGVRVQELMSVFDRSSALTVRPGEMATVSLRCAEPLALDDYADVPETGRFVLAAGHDVIGGGIIDARRYPDERIHAKPVSENITPVGHKITPTERARRYGHRGAVIWLTGLSGSGKSTLSMELERQLFQAGCAAYVLDGDNVRRGLNTNLGFSPEDRKENIRRVGEVAALFADAGLVCITAFISPYREDRAIARSAVKTGAFYEIHVRADLATCERRDPKGLYSKARRGELKGMTGIDAPYEPPESPDLVVDTATESVEQSVAQLLQFVQSRIREFSSAAL
jgi:bifunctional enzyme CysN/CysC